MMMHLCSRKTRNFPCLGSSAHDEAPQVDGRAVERMVSGIGQIHSSAWGGGGDLSKPRTTSSRKGRSFHLIWVWCHSRG